MQHNTAIKSPRVLCSCWLPCRKHVCWMNKSPGWEELSYQMCLISLVGRQCSIITMNNLESGHYFLLQYLWTLKNEACSNVWSSAHTFRDSFQVGQTHRFHRRICDMLQISSMLQYDSASWDKTSCSPIRGLGGFWGVGQKDRLQIPSEITSTFWIFRQAGWGDELFYFLFSKFHCANQVVIKQGSDPRETSFPTNI